MNQGMQAFKSAIPNNDYINSIFAYDVRTLEQTSDITISQYVIALSQYLIYFKSNFNKTKTERTSKDRLLEASVVQLLTPELIKKYKYKKDAKADLIFNNAQLSKLQTELESVQDEIFILEGIDKTISELIAAFKRELTRRENELYQQRHGRS